MAKRITLRNNTSSNTGKGAKMAHAEMDANLETFFMSSSLDGTTLYLHSTGSVNTDAIDLSGIVGAGAQGIQGAQGTTGSGTQGPQGQSGIGTQGTAGTPGTQGAQGIAGGASSQGLQGIQGIEGSSIQGAQGTTGSGTQGAQGIIGTGTQGAQGILGNQGVQGIQGSNGTQGLTGSGTQGVQGIQGPAAVGSQGTVIAPFAFASVNTTANGSGEGISWSNWDSLNSTLDFTFATPQPDTDYTVVTDTEVFDDYFVSITNKTVNGFKASFYDDTQNRTPSTFSEFTFLVYASNPLIVTGVGAQGIAGIQGSNGTQGITGTSGVTTGRIYYFNKSVIEVAGYSQLGITPTGGAETSIPVLSSQNTDTKITEFISDPFDFTIIPGGVQRFQLWMTKENQNDHIETYVILKLADNAGSTLATVGTSQAVDVEWNNNNTTPASVTVDITLPTAAVSVGQRMLVEVWSRNNENQDYTTTLYTEGAAHYSYVITTVAAQEGAQGVQGIQGTTGTGIQGPQGTTGTGTPGTQGVQGIQGPSASSNSSATLGSSSETLGDHTDNNTHAVQTNWTRLATSGASFTNLSGGTKSYLVVLGLEMTATYTGSGIVPFGIDIKFADIASGAIVYTEWRDTVFMSYASEVASRVTKTYVSHAFQLDNGADFAVYVKGTPYLSEQLSIQYSLLTVTELTGTAIGTLN